jgi:hypothetical protein
MLSLNEYQRQVYAEIFGCSVEQSSGLTSAAMSVHRGTVFNSWMRALRLGFPSVRACVPAEFDSLADDFMRCRPPRHPCLQHYGAGFPDFLAARSNSQLPAFLVDIARFDLALEQVAHKTPGPHCLTFEIAPTIELRLNPSVTRLDTCYAVDLVRDAVEAGASDPLLGLDMSCAPRRFAIWRGPSGPTVRQLSPSAADFLAALLAGDSLTDAIGVTASGHQQSTLLLQAIRSEILTASFVDVIRIS